MVWNFLKFGRKPEYDKVLEDLHVQMTKVEASIQRNKARETSYDSKWIIYATLVYLAISAVTIIFFPQDSEFLVLRFLPLAIGPFIIFFVRKVLRAYFRRHIKSLETFLEFLRSEQSSKVEEIKKNEPYYRAKQLLERYEAPARKTQEEASAAAAAAATAAGQPIRHRPSPAPGQGNPAAQQQRGPPTMNQNAPGPQMGQQRPLLHVMQSAPQPGPSSGPQQPGPSQQPGFPQPMNQGRPLPPPQFYHSQAPRAPEKQTWMDKLVEMAVGDSQAATMNSMLVKLQRENEQLRQMLLQRDRALATVLAQVPGSKEGSAESSEEPKESEEAPAPSEPAGENEEQNQNQPHKEPETEEASGSAEKVDSEVQANEKVDSPKEDGTSEKRADSKKED